VTEHRDESALEKLGKLLPLLRRLRVRPQREVGGRYLLPAERPELVDRRAPQLTMAPEVLVADRLTEERALPFDATHLHPEALVPRRMDDQRLIPAVGDAVDGVTDDCLRFHAAWRDTTTADRLPGWR